MTTIAFRDGVLAADTLAVSLSHYRCGRIEKISRAPTGELLAMTGFAPTTFDLREWWLAGRSGPQPNNEHAGTLVVIRNGGITLYCGGGSQPEVEADYYAYGAGCEIAMGAMAMGATAREAVEVAARLNIYTGGDIMTLALADA